MPPDTRDPLSRLKKKRRSEAQSVRDSLSPDNHQRASSSINQHLIRLITFLTSPPHQEAPELLLEAEQRFNVASFFPFRSEVDICATNRWLCEHHTLLLPRITTTKDLHQRTSSKMEFVRCKSLNQEDFSLSRFGTLEPKEGEVVPLHTLDVVITPGLLFTKEGGRLGYGGGYYDRLFRTLKEDERCRKKVTFLGVGFSCQVVEEVPMDVYDLRLDYVVHEFFSFQQVVHMFRGGVATPLLSTTEITSPQ